MHVELIYKMYFCYLYLNLKLIYVTLGVVVVFCTRNIKHLVYNLQMQDLQRNELSL